MLYCGSSFTKGLYDKILKLGHMPIMIPSATPLDVILGMVPEPDGIIITGSGDYVNAHGAAVVDVGIYDLGVPVLGICYGMQRMAVDLGGTVKKMADSEVQLCDLEFTDAGHESFLFTDFADESCPTWMAHNCRVTVAPDFFVTTGTTEMTPIAAMECVERRLYGLQFHPEHTGRDNSDQAGTAIITRFLEDVCD